MAGLAAPSLQRSMETFRRSGSSGLVWEDRFISEDLSQARKKREEGVEFRELRPSRSVGTTGQLERSLSNGNGGGGGGAAPRPYRTGKVSPALDPPSPKVSGCGFCGIFGHAGGGSGAAAKKPKPRKR